MPLTLHSLPNLKFLVKIDLEGMSRAPRLGRNPWDGYFRGCALQYANLAQICYADPVFADALRLANQRSIVTPQNLMNLFVLIKFYLPAIPHGHIVEYGSYKGGSAMFMAAIAKALLPGVRVFAFDTFVGMPTTDRDIELHRSGDFADASLAEIGAAAAAAGLDNLAFIQGTFEQTAAKALQTIGPVALTHIDCDIRSAICCAYDATKPHMVPGSYIAFDDPLVSSCLGAFEAVEELLIRRDGLHAEQVSPHLVFRFPPLPSGSAE
jgi:hypothetical protein